jgi:hypothetical protein
VRMAKAVPADVYLRKRLLSCSGYGKLILGNPCFGLPRQLLFGRPERARLGRARYCQLGQLWSAAAIAARTPALLPARCRLCLGGAAHAAIC